MSKWCITWASIAAGRHRPGFWSSVLRCPGLLGRFELHANQISQYKCQLPDMQRHKIYGVCWACRLSFWGTAMIENSGRRARPCTAKGPLSAGKLVPAVMSVLRLDRRRAMAASRHGRGVHRFKKVDLFVRHHTDRYLLFVKKYCMFLIRQLHSIHRGVDCCLADCV